MAENIRQTPSGKWQARYRPRPNQRRSKTFDTYREAKAFLATVNAEVVTGTHVDPSKGQRVTVAEVAERWYTAHAVSLKPTTRQRYREVLNGAVLSEWGSAPLSALDTPAIQDWITEATEHVAPRTVRERAQVLRQVLDYAVDTRLLPTNPATRLRLPKDQYREMLVLEAAQVHALAEAITPPYGTLVRFAAWSGLRAGEFTALRTRDVDPLRGEVRVTASVTTVDGKRVRGSTKTDRPRTVTVPRRLAAEVGELMLPDPDAPVFRSPRGSEIGINNWRQRHWRPAVHAALPPHLHALRIHDLRHTCASLLIADGWDVASVSRHLGHKNPSVTLNIYTHLLESHADELRARTDATYEAATTQGGAVLPLAR